MTRRYQTALGPSGLKARPLPILAGLSRGKN
jgi:hypothetical protein